MRESSPTPYLGPQPVPKMPAGFVDLVEGLTREVLKNNPRDLYGFCAKHLEKLLEVRDGRPVRNPVLTLEEKIRQAQEKVRQKAKERRERYDLKTAALQQSEQHDGINDQTINNYEEITKRPVHEDQKLVLASEVEIAQKSYDDEINIDKNNVVLKLPEISIQKPDDNDDFQQNVANDDKITDETIENEQKLSPENGEITNHGNNNIIQNSLKEENNTQPTSNDNLKEDKNFEKEEKPERKDTESEVLSQNSSVNVDDICNKGEFKKYDEYDNGTEQVADIQLLTDITETNITEDSETTRTSIPVIANDITETQSINDSNDVNPIAEKNTTNVTIDVHGDVKIENTEIVKEVEDESINNGEYSQSVAAEVDQQSNAPQGLKAEDISKNSSVVSNIENISSDSQEPRKSEARLSTNEHVSSDINETVSSKNTTTNDDVSLETNKKANEPKVINYISKDPEVNEEVNSEENKTSENVIEVNNDSQQSRLDENTKKDDSIVDVNVPEGKIEETTQEKNKQLNDDRPSIEIPENGDANDDKKSRAGSDVPKIEDSIVKDNQNEQSNMDLETAAVTIQKVFRSFLFKSRNSTFDDITNEETTSLDEDSEKKEEYYAAANISKERRALGINRMDTVLQTVNEEKSLSLSTDDSSTLSSAATTIQAHVRGFLVRNRLNTNKTVSTNSLAYSNENLEFDTDDQQKNKTVLNIHIVPEEANYLSRDESIITSMELSLDGSPPSSIGLHPLSYDVSERRKLLKREDAVQSISPPSNNSGKLSEESVKEVFINDDTLLVSDDIEKKPENITELCNDSGVDSDIISTSSTVTATTVINTTDLTKSPTNSETEDQRSKSLQKIGSDESDVVTPHDASPRSSIGDYENRSKLVHSGEFHDVLLPTRVSRSDTTVVREFKNVLVYFFIWRHS